MMDDVDKMKARIDRMERLETAESDLDASQAVRIGPDRCRDAHCRGTELATKETTQKKLAAYRHWLCTGRG